jgi:serine/threonine-protein kinase
VLCPDENSLAALAEGGAPSESRVALARHLDECTACRIAVGSVVRLHGRSNAGALAFGATEESGETPSATASTHCQALAAGDVVGGRFRLDEIVGEGGLGVVWAATHLVTQKRVALKILKFRYAEVDKRFLREARVSGLVRHPNIVDVHDVLQLEDGSLAMVMDLLVGTSLDVRIQGTRALSLRDTLDILCPVLEALDAAHELGIIHRDLKPQNIFLAHDMSGEMQPVLLDFGLAKLTATEGSAAQTSVLTAERQVLGTPLYMAPEQLYGEADIDIRADVWAVGVVLFECLVGRRPITGNTVGHILRSLATQEIPKVGALVELPNELASLIDAALVRDRVARLPRVTPIVEVAKRLRARTS